MGSEVQSDERSDADNELRLIILFRDYREILRLGRQLAEQT